MKKSRQGFTAAETWRGGGTNNKVPWLLMEVPNGDERVPLTECREGYVQGSGWRHGLGLLPILQVVLCAGGTHRTRLLRSGS